MASNVSRETSERLEKFARLLNHWSGTLNLVGRAATEDIWARHINDSLQLISFIPQGTQSFVDVGSGAGFPAIPIAVATGMFAHLVEADRRKAAFLQVAITEIAISATVWNSRAQIASVPLQPVCTARAVAPLSSLIRLCRPLMLPEGVGIFPKGRTFKSEMQAVKDQTVEIHSYASVTDSEAAILVATFR